jgi:hypothetical protein
MSESIFTFDLDCYKQDIDPINHYVEQAAFYLHKTKNISVEKAEQIIRDAMAERKGPFAHITDRQIKYTSKKENGDREVVTGSFINYIKNINDGDVIVAPTLTTYIPHHVKEALSVKFVEANKKKRAQAKELKFKYKLSNEVVKSVYYDIQQTYKKNINNAFSGALSSPYTILYFKTGHSTLTTATRMTTSNSNSLNEKLLTGNRHYYHLDVILSNITFIVSQINKDEIYSVINKYNLYVPTVNDCLDVINRSAKLYCLYNYEDKVLNLLNTLDDAERSWFVYCNDFYHLTMFNKNLIYSFFDKITQVVNDQVEYDEKNVFDYPAEYRMCASQICYSLIKGYGKDYKKMKESGVLNPYVSTIKNCYDRLNEIGDLFSAFFKNKIMPHSVAHFPSSLRRCVLTSDTDSTIPTYQEIIFSYLGKEEFSEKGRALQGFLILLTSYVTANTLLNMSAQFNAPKERLKNIFMKNEFTFDSYVLTQMAKHYYATISVQEGNVFSEPEREYKGVHLISSNLPLKIRTMAKEMMNSIMDKTISNEKLSIVEYLTYVKNIETEIVDSIKRGELTYFKVYKIKDTDSYKADQFNPYRYAELWNCAFGPRYGVIETYPYQAIKVSTTLVNKTKVSEWVSQLDPITRENVAKWVKDNNKKDIPMIMLPASIITSRGMPAELVKIINYRSIVKEICKIFYTILGTIGFYIKEDYIVSDYFRASDSNSRIHLLD